MPYQEGDTAGNGAYVFKNGGWQLNSQSPAPAPSAASDTPSIGIGEDIAKSAPSELTKGVLQAATSVPSTYQLGRQAAKDYLPEGWPHTIKKAGEAIRPYLGDTVGGLADAATDPRLTYGSVLGKVEDKFGPMTEPQTTTGKYVGEGLQLLPSMLGPGGPEEAGLKWLPWLARRGLALGGAAVGSEGAGELSQAYLRDDAEPWMRMAGALLGGGLGPKAPRIISPASTTPERAALADRVTAAGVPLSAAQDTGSKFLNWAENWMGQPEKYNAETQKAAATPALLKTMGVNSPIATKDVLKQGTADISDRLDNLRSSTELKFDPKLTNDLKVARAKSWGAAKPDPDNPNAVDTAIQKILYGVSGKPMKAGSVVTGIKGDYYDDLHKEISNNASQILGKKNPGTPKVVGNALLDVRDALDGAMERSLASNPKTADLAGEWAKVRAQRAATGPLKKAQQAPGAEEGILDPAQVFAHAGNDSSELGGLSRAMTAVLKRPPTDPKLRMAPGALGTLGGLGYGLAQGAGLEPTAVLGLAGGTTTQAASEVARLMARKPYYSPLIQKWLKSRVVPKGPATSFDSGTVSRLLLTQPSKYFGADNP